MTDEVFRIERASVGDLTGACIYGWVHSDIFRRTRRIQLKTANGFSEPRFFEFRHPGADSIQVGLPLINFRELSDECVLIRPFIIAFRTFMLCLPL